MIVYTCFESFGWTRNSCLYLPRVCWFLSKNLNFWWAIGILVVDRKYLILSGYIETHLERPINQGSYSSLGLVSTHTKEYKNCIIQNCFHFLNIVSCNHTYEFSKTTLLKMLCMSLNFHHPAYFKRSLPSRQRVVGSLLSVRFNYKPGYKPCDLLYIWFLSLVEITAFRLWREYFNQWEQSNL